MELELHDRKVTGGDDEHFVAAGLLLQRLAPNFCQEDLTGVAALGEDCHVIDC
jgi:hypothetical protein